MKAKEKDSLKNLSVAELEAEIRKAEEKRFKLAFKHQTAPLDNPTELRNLRRRVARIKTWIGEQRRAAS